MRIHSRTATLFLPGNRLTTAYRPILARLLVLVPIIRTPRDHPHATPAAVLAWLLQLVRGICVALEIIFTRKALRALGAEMAVWGRDVDFQPGQKKAWVWLQKMVLELSELTIGEIGRKGGYKSGEGLRQW